MPCNCQASNPHSPIPPGGDGCVIRRPTAGSREHQLRADLLASPPRSTSLLLVSEEPHHTGIESLLSGYSAIERGAVAELTQAPVNTDPMIRTEQKEAQPHYGKYI